MKIAIRGHASRGKEIIQIFKDLGGNNSYYHEGSCINLYYFITESGVIDFAYKENFVKNYNFYTLEEFEKEFPFKIGDEVIIVGLPDFPKVITQMMWDCDEILYSFEGLNNTWFGTKSLKKFEMKEERNITLTLDKAKEWYNKGGELKEVALQAYSEKELNPLPRSWEEYCDNYPVRTGENWLGIQDSINTCNADLQPRYYKNWIPSKKSAEAHLALIQLEQLRDCWRQGWKPNCNDKYQSKFCINRYQNTIGVDECYVIGHFLSFPTREMTEEFLKCFRDLIEKAGDLI